MNQKKILIKFSLLSTKGFAGLGQNIDLRTKHRFLGSVRAFTWSNGSLQRWGVWGPEKESDFPKASQQGSIQSAAVSTHLPIFLDIGSCKIFFFKVKGNLVWNIQKEANTWSHFLKIIFFLNRHKYLYWALTVHMHYSFNHHDNSMKYLL